jgi:hypothetical protein
MGDCGVHLLMNYSVDDAVRNAGSIILNGTVID